VKPSDTGEARAFADWFRTGEELRHARLRSMWKMTADERVAAMRRGELTIEQLAAWSACRPDELPIVNGEFEWLVMFTPEACE
jgi:hypothetical protein